MRILLLAAEPSDLARIRLDREFRAVQDSRRRSKYRDRFQVHYVPDARPSDLHREILHHRPQIVQFCGHGTGGRGLALEDERGAALLVSAQALAELFRLFEPDLRCVVLNACYSEEQASEIHRHVDFVVGMKKEVADTAAICFSRGFYDALFAGETVEEAFKHGKAAIRIEGPHDSAPSATARHLRPLEAAADVAIPEYLKPEILIRPGAEPFPSESGASCPTSAEIETRVDAASLLLLRWETTVDGGKWIDRPELQRAGEWLDNGEGSRTLVLLGEPGSGKSALLARLGQRIKARGKPVLAIKADSIARDVKGLADLTDNLKLPTDILGCIRRLAAAGEVVVLIDQLDAMASLLDLHSERLNVLLGLVHDLSREENVRVVCSCRLFEFGHDVRLSSIQAESLTLNLPTWSQVAELLQVRGINADPWPEEFRELLRTPQHLKVFLERLRDGSEYRIFNSYQQMLDDLWDRGVSDPGGPPGRAELLMEMAEGMAETESLWLPLARYEGREGAIRDLEAKGLLARNEGGLGVGFRHQTLFEHARARAFARGHGSISAHTLARQDSLFVRPTLWNTLRYLREATPEAYHDEMGRLWAGATRRHIRLLLVDFLGQVQAPTEREQAWMIRALADPDYRPRALGARRGGEGGSACSPRASSPPR